MNNDLFNNGGPEMGGLPAGDWMPDPCHNCGCPVYDQKFMIMRQSMLLSTDGREKIGLHPVMTCAQCGWVHGSKVEDKAAPTVDDVPDNITKLILKPNTAPDGDPSDMPPPLD